MEKIEIESVERLDVRPGDVLLVTVPVGTSPQDVEAVRNAFETRLPVRALVKTADVQVVVVGEDAA